MDRFLDDLEVFSNASQISKITWEVANKLPTKYFYSLADQTIRAGDSIAASIAEGYGRSTNKDKLRFIFIARGSLYELRFWINKLLERNLLENKKGSEIIQLLDYQGKLIHRYMNYLRRESK